MSFLINYFKKFGGKNDGSKVPPRPKLVVLIWSFLGAFLGIAAVTGISTYTILADENLIPAVMGSIGAMAILIYGSIDVALAQPRNFIFGNLFSALIGILVELIFIKITGSATALLWLKSALAVSISLVVMQLTRTVHPPAGATALIAVSGGQKFYDIGFLYMAIPVLFSVGIMLVVALIVNNIMRQYPLYWFNPDLDIRKEIEALRSKKNQKVDLINHEFTNDVNNNSKEDAYLENIPSFGLEDITASSTFTINVHQPRHELEILKLKEELLSANMRIKELEMKLHME
ncbi:hypothetical protein K502DRAFT_367375 [Neoconidiobolus thromboides FSU 785]|nr:hypothetical protein K502DRAFT_367375 [Neoconidiobolus thromboides FSU 785]